MKMPKKYDDKLFIDMPFGEALERYAGVRPGEMHANIEKSKKKKPPSGNAAKRRGKQPPGGHDHEIKTSSVVVLGDVRTRKRNNQR
jgi:hypothetical protein